MTVYIAYDTNTRIILSQSDDEDCIDNFIAVADEVCEKATIPEMITEETIYNADGSLTEAPISDVVLLEDQAAGIS